MHAYYYIQVVINVILWLLYIGTNNDTTAATAVSDKSDGLSLFERMTRLEADKGKELWRTKEGECMYACMYILV